MDNAAIERARQWFEFYRDERGYQPLPSRPDEKRPFRAYSHLWTESAPRDLFDQFPTSNIQIMTGRFWGLLVIDLDGPEAIEQWPKIAPCCPRTWITHSGGGGRHVWFSIPCDLPPMPKAVLWRVDPTKPRVKGESAIERLCDGSLVMAPPSIHPRTGRMYRFLGGHSPKEIPRPARCPAWVLKLEAVKSARPDVVPPSRPIAPKAVKTRYGASVRTADILDAISDKIALARSWGLRFASTKPNAAGWCAVHAYDRDDRSPSASFSPESGRYWEPELGKSVGLFELGAMLGIYATWEDARSDLCSTFVTKEEDKTKRRQESEAIASSTQRLNPRAPDGARVRSIQCQENSVLQQ